MAIDGVGCGPGESAAQLAEFIAKARALSAKYRTERVRYKARAEVVPVTREMLGCAVCGQLAGLASLVWSVREETYQRPLTLCMATAAFVAVDVSRRSPAGGSARGIARFNAGPEEAIRCSEAVVHAYRAEAELGTRPATSTVVDAAKAAGLTIPMTGRMVFRFRPAGSAWWEYLDHAWGTSVVEHVLDLWCPRP